MTAIASSILVVLFARVLQVRKSTTLKDDYKAEGIAAGDSGSPPFVAGGRKGCWTDSGHFYLL